jgi:hypothetical protein
MYPPVAGYGVAPAGPLAWVPYPPVVPWLPVGKPPLGGLP